MPGPNTTSAEDYTTGKKMINDSPMANSSPSKKFEKEDIDELRREIEVKKEELSGMGSLAE